MDKRGSGPATSDDVGRRSWLGGVWSSLTAWRERRFPHLYAVWLLLQPLWPTLIIGGLTFYLFVWQPQVREALLVVDDRPETLPREVGRFVVDAIVIKDIAMLWLSSLLAAIALAVSAHMAFMQSWKRENRKAVFDFNASDRSKWFYWFWPNLAAAAPLAGIFTAFAADTASQCGAGNCFDGNGWLVAVLYAATIVAVWVWPFPLPWNASNIADPKARKTAEERGRAFVFGAILVALAVWAVLFAAVFHIQLVRALNVPALVILFIGCAAVLLNGVLLQVRWSRFWTPLGVFVVAALWLLAVSRVATVHPLRTMADGGTSGFAMVLAVAALLAIALVAIARARGPAELATVRVVLLVAAVAIVGVVVGGRAPHGLRAAAATTPDDEVGPERTRISARRTVGEHLAKWLDDRLAGGRNDPQHPYPLVIASAQGGGIRAAYWTAAVLGTLHDADRNFTCHLFAISGVSGGSVGALAFVAGLKRDPERGGCKGGSDVTQLPRDVVAADDKRAAVAAAAAGATFGSGSARLLDCEAGAGLATAAAGEASPREADGRVRCRVRSALSRDFLAPVIARLLFADTVLAFWPVAQDRQTAIEAQFYDAFCEAAGPADGDDPGFRCKSGGNLFSEGFMAVTRPDPAKTDTPALFLNASDVVSGARFIASDLRVARETDYEAGDLLAGCMVAEYQWTGIDFPCADRRRQALPAWSAAGASARFPWISPPGSFEAAFISRLGAEPKTPEEKQRALEVARKTAPTTVKLLDGGIAEASGALTMMELANLVNRQCRQLPDAGVVKCVVLKTATGYELCQPAVSTAPGTTPSDCTENGTPYYITVGLLMLDNGPWTFESEEKAATSRSNLGWVTRPFEAATAPLSAVLSSRTGRGREALSRASGDTTITLESGRALEVLLPDDTADPKACGDVRPRSVPLGWMLAKDTRDYIEACVNTMANGALPNARFQQWWNALIAPYPNGEGWSPTGKDLRAPSEASAVPGVELTPASGSERPTLMQ